MNNDLTVPIVISVIFHLSIFFLFSYQKRPVFHAIPIELSFYNPPSNLTAGPVPSGSENDRLITPSKKDEIAVNKKKKKKNNKKIKTKKHEIKKTETPIENKAEQPVDNAQTAPVSQAEGNTGGRLGSPINLDSAKFPYSYYTNQIVKKIEKNWQWSNDFGQVKSVVFFSIQKDGSIKNIEIKESSGDDVFDQQALRAVELANPLPPLPKGYEEENLGVYFEFKLK